MLSGIDARRAGQQAEVVVGRAEDIVRSVGIDEPRIAADVASPAQFTREALDATVVERQRFAGDLRRFVDPTVRDIHPENAVGQQGGIGDADVLVVEAARLLDGLVGDKDAIGDLAAVILREDHRAADASQVAGKDAIDQIRGVVQGIDAAAAAVVAVGLRDVAPENATSERGADAVDEYATAPLSSRIVGNHALHELTAGLVQAAAVGRRVVADHTVARRSRKFVHPASKALRVEQPAIGVAAGDRQPVQDGRFAAAGHDVVTVLAVAAEVQVVVAVEVAAENGLVNGDVAGVGMAPVTPA